MLDSCLFPEVKCKQPRPGFELRSLIPFPTLNVLSWMKLHKCINGNTKSYKLIPVLEPCSYISVSTIYIYIYIYIYCREEKNFVFWFGAQFDSTLNFTQSGWLILFTLDLHFRPPNRVSCQTHPLWLENADQCRRPTGCSSIAMLWLYNAAQCRHLTAALK